MDRLLKEGEELFQLRKKLKKEGKFLVEVHKRGLKETSAYGRMTPYNLYLIAKEVFGSEKEAEEKILLVGISKAYLLLKKLKEKDLIKRKEGVWVLNCKEGADCRKVRKETRELIKVFSRSSKREISKLLKLGEERERTLYNQLVDILYKIKEALGNRGLKELLKKALKEIKGL